MTSISSDTTASSKSTELEGQRSGTVAMQFSPEAYAVAAQNAALLGVPVSQVISEALALQREVIQAKATGARVLLEKRGSYLRELTPRISK